MIQINISKRANCLLNKSKGSFDAPFHLQKLIILRMGMTRQLLSCRNYQKTLFVKCKPLKVYMTKYKPRTTIHRKVQIQKVQLILQQSIIRFPIKYSVHLILYFNIESCYSCKQSIEIFSLHLTLFVFMYCHK